LPPTSTLTADQLLLGSDRGLDPPVDLDKGALMVKAPSSSQQLKQIGLGKCRICAEFERQRALQVPANLFDQSRTKVLGALAVVEVDGMVFEPQDLPGLR
jgi:hypothetical protein